MLDFHGFEIKCSLPCCNSEEGSTTSCPNPVLFYKNGDDKTQNNF